MKKLFGRRNLKKDGTEGKVRLPAALGAGLCQLSWLWPKLSARQAASQHIKHAIE